MTHPDEQISPEFEQVMNDLARHLDYVFNAKGPKTTGFVLLTFPFGPVDGPVNYISNGANRKDIVCLMKEMIARFEGQPEIKGSA